MGGSCVFIIYKVALVHARIKPGIALQNSQTNTVLGHPCIPGYMLKIESHDGLRGQEEYFMIASSSINGVDELMNLFKISLDICTR